MLNFIPRELGVDPGNLIITVANVRDFLTKLCHTLPESIDLTTQCKFGPKSLNKRKASIFIVGCLSFRLIPVQNFPFIASAVLIVLRYV